MPARFKQLFWQPPRAHGDVIEDRSVSFLELFYDLVYVVVIAQAAHTLAEDITWRTVGEFAVIFSMIWIAWLNGTLYYDLHGREDGRTRVSVFIQMGILALLAVYTGHAAGDDGAAFAATYTAFLLVMTYLWWAVSRQDSAEYLPITRRYLMGNVLSVIVIFASIFLPNGARMGVWAAFVIATAAASVIMIRFTSDRLGLTIDIVDSTVERFGLFTIIVLGEVVVGVVDGLSEAERDTVTFVTGMFGLMIGFAIWWTYFDFVGRRMPAPTTVGVGRWIMSHLPVTMAIAALGASLVGLIEHAADSRTPTPNAWLASGSVALALVALVITMSSLRDFERVSTLYRPIAVAAVLAAVGALGVGALRPTPWLLALLLVVLLSAVWWFAVDRLLRMDNPASALPGYEDG